MAERSSLNHLSHSLPEGSTTDRFEDGLVMCARRSQDRRPSSTPRSARAGRPRRRRGMQGETPRPASKLAPERPPGQSAQARVPPARVQGSSFLPAHPTSFIGRERELAEIRRLFATTRLLTLSGGGGVGKTRLAIEIAAGLRAEFPQGICFIDLAPLANPRLLITTLAHALGLRDTGEQPLAERLERYLRPRKLLLVLDNCEHMVDTCAQLIGPLLQTCPNLRVVATSRQPFRSAGEVAWRVPSLTLPEAGDRETVDAVMRSESGRLFAERARSARPDFVVTDAAARHIGTICRRLDRHPARAGTCGRTCRRPRRRGDRPPAHRPFPPPHARKPRGPAPSPDAARDDRLESSVALGTRADALSPAVGVRGRLRAPGGGGRLRRRDHRPRPPERQGS